MGIPTLTEQLRRELTSDLQSQGPRSAVRVRAATSLEHELHMKPQPPFHHLPDHKSPQGNCSQMRVRFTSEAHQDAPRRPRANMIQAKLSEVFQALRHSHRPHPVLSTTLPQALPGTLKSVWDIRRGCFQDLEPWH